MLLKTSRYDTETSDGAFKATLKGAIPGAALGGGLGAYALGKSMSKMHEDILRADLEAELSNDPNVVKRWLKKIWARKPMAYPVIGALAGVGLGGLAAHAIHDRFKKSRRDAVDRRKQLKMKKTGATLGIKAEDVSARDDRWTPFALRAAKPRMASPLSAMPGGLTGNVLDDTLFMKSGSSTDDSHRRFAMRKFGAIRRNSEQEELNARTKGNLYGFAAGTAASYPLARYLYKPQVEAARSTGKMLEFMRLLAHIDRANGGRVTPEAMNNLNAAIKLNNKVRAGNTLGKAGLMLSLGTLGGYLGDYLALRNYKQRNIKD